ncbi:MAG: hypothetical protein WCP31_07085 [Chloroflexales bacterium]
MHVRWLLLFTLLATLLVSVDFPQQAKATPAKPTTLAAATCTETTQASRSKWKICLPTAPVIWNDSVVVWAHGYQAPGYPATYQDTLSDGTYVPDLVTSLGYAFITATYPANGLVVIDAEADLLALIASFNTTHAATPARKVYLAGASMGGLITAQLAERNPNGVFNGALALCGIVGDFPRQVKYWGDFNALYRTLFANVVASWTTQPISMTTQTVWESTYQPTIIAGVMSNTTAAGQLIMVAKAAIDPLDYTTAVTTIAGLSYFTFLSREDSAVRLGGNPVDNHAYWYRGSTNDMALNKLVPRETASPAAVTAMQEYATTGQPKIPLVLVHTSYDPIVPVEQSLLYILKKQAAGNTKVTPFLVSRYGHCEFKSAEVQDSFSLLVAQVNGLSTPGTIPSWFPFQSTTLISGTAVLSATEAFSVTNAVPDPYVFTRNYTPLVAR